MKALAIVTMFIGLIALPANSHEFWLSMRDYQVEPGRNIVASLRLGSNMHGSTLVYLPGDIERFEILEPGGARRVKGRYGDDPALSVPAGADGLAVVVYQSGLYMISYDKWETFQKFVTHKAFPGLPEAHLARGLPETGFAESYRRYAKALVGVGGGAGADRATGMYIEIVALANPYTDDLGAGLPLKVLLQGAPRAGVQLELYDTAPNGKVTSVKYRTDAQGIAVVKVKPGHEYLADNVILETLDNTDPKAGPVWHSAWASLTFRVPG